MRRVLVVEDDLAWCEIIGDVLADEGFTADWASTLERARNKLKSVDGYEAVIVDAGLGALMGQLAGAMTHSGEFPIPLIPGLDLVVESKFKGIVFLASAFYNYDELTRIIMVNYSNLPVVCVDKRTGDLSSVSKTLSASPVDNLALFENDPSVAMWENLISRPGSDKSGRLLEDAAAAMFEISGHFDLVTKRQRTASQEIDIVLVRDTGIGFAAYNLVLAECKDRGSLVTASDVHVFAAKLRRVGSSLGIFISRRGLTGAKRGGGAVAVINELYISDKIAIIALSFDECLRIASGSDLLAGVIREKIIGVRLGRS